MKSELYLVVIATLSVLASAGSAAEREQNTRGRQTQFSRETANAGQVFKASDALGKDVQSRQNQDLGDLKEMAVDVESGRIVHAIVSTGVGGRTVAVPPKLLSYDANKKVLRLDATREKLAAAPEFDMAKWNDYEADDRVAEIYKYYGQQPDAKNPPRATGISAENRAGKPGGLERASKLVGSKVENLQDQNLGKVEDLILDLQAGRIAHVILSSGGFLGIGDALSAIPPTSFRYDGDKENLRIDMTKDALAKAPHFKANEWPDFNDPSYSAGVYRAHNADPYFDTDKPADNTARNVRDRRDDAITPRDQGSSEADVETTRQIRREILNQKDVSVNAKNVKIITANGKVTLRGPVNSEEEKRMVAQIAERVAQRGNVDNQLEVKRENQNQP